jgi:hypothetical protein
MIVYSQYPSSVFSENQEFPLFTNKSETLDALTAHLFQTGILRIGGFDTMLDLDQFRFEKDRSHQFQLLSFQWFNRIINTRGHRESQVVFGRYWEKVLYPLIVEINKSTKEPFFMAWNDHAYALRTLSLCKMFVLSEGEIRTRIRTLLIDAVAFLSNEKNYDALSNHGWDQAKSLLIASRLINEDAKVGMQRFRKELNQAFTVEGVHVENSPHYHIHMLNNLIHTIGLFREIGVDETFIHEMYDIAKKSVLYYQVVLRDNGSIPLIGDSQQTPPNLNPITKEFIVSNSKEIKNRDFFPFPETGYCYWKYNWGEKAVHFSMKNSHFSRYHRHDDDLSITLNVDGNEVFLDGGLYKYEEKEEQRLFFRSPYSHSTIILPNCEPQRQMGYEIKNESHDKAKIFTSNTNMWDGIRVTRCVEKREDNQFLLKDSVPINVPFFQVLFQTIAQKIEISNKAIYLKYADFTIFLDFAAIEGQVENIKLQDSIYSPKYDVISTSKTIIVTSSSQNLNYTINLIQGKR